MNCPNCNTPNPNGSGFCMNCGAKMPAEALCPHCHTPITPGSAFCLNCGAPVGAPAQNVQYAAPAQPTYYAAPAQSPTQAPRGGFCGKGIASLILSMLSLFFSWNPFAIFTGVCGILGIVFGAGGIKQATAQNQSGKGLAIAGLVVGIVATVISFTIGALVGIAWIEVYF